MNVRCLMLLALLGLLAVVCGKRANNLRSLQEADDYSSSNTGDASEETYGSADGSSDGSDVSDYASDAETNGEDTEGYEGDQPADGYEGDEPADGYEGDEPADEGNEGDESATDEEDQEEKPKPVSHTLHATARKAAKFAVDRIRSFTARKSSAAKPAMKKVMARRVNKEKPKPNPREKKGPENKKKMDHKEKPKPNPREKKGTPNRGGKRSPPEFSAEFSE